MNFQDTRVTERCGKKKSRMPAARRLIQLASFLLFPGLFVLTFSSIGELVRALVSGTFAAAALSQQLLLTAAVALVTVLFGRFFCGFLCSFGAAGDLFWKLGRLLKLPRLRLPEKTDALLKKGKFAVLALFAVFSWLLGWSLPAAADPWNVFGQVAVVGSMPAFAALLSLGGALLAAILLLSMFSERAFCRWLCPLGALFSLLSHFRLFRIRKPRTACGACKACTAHCPMGIALAGMDRVDSDECINCLSCVSICPRGNVRADPTPAVSAAVALGTMTSFYFAGSLTASAASNAAVSAASSSAVSAAASSSAAGKYADGSYTGSAAGYRGTTSVTVTVANGVITDITVDGSGDTASFLSKAKSAVIAEILAAQSTDVDTVAGATFSSNGILNAVENALSAAGASGTSSAVSKAVASAAAGTSSAASTDTSAAASDAAAESAASASEAAGSYADGTYTGSGTGLRGTTTVTVTVADGSITDIMVDDYADDEQFFSRAQETVIAEILSAQSTDVDTVAGATFSSNGILEAVSDALGLDFTNPNASSAAAGGHRR